MKEISQLKSVRQFDIVCGYMVKEKSDNWKSAALTCIDVTSY